MTHPSFTRCKWHTISEGYRSTRECMPPTRQESGRPVRCTASWLSCHGLLACRGAPALWLYPPVWLGRSTPGRAVRHRLPVFCPRNRGRIYPSIVMNYFDNVCLGETPCLSRNIDYCTCSRCQLPDIKSPCFDEPCSLCRPFQPLLWS